MSLQVMAELVLANRDWEAVDADWPGRPDLYQAILLLSQAVDKFHATACMDSTQGGREDEREVMTASESVEISPTLPWKAELGDELS